MTYTQLPDLNHRLIGIQAVSAGTIVEQQLEAIDSLLSSATYYDGSSRTPGSGSAWTSDREDGSGTLVSVRCTPPLADVSDLRVVFGGQTAAATPVMATSNTFTAGNLYVSVARGVTDVATFNGWAASPMYSTGDQTGFGVFFAGGSGATPKHIAVIESQETLWVIATSDVANFPCYPGGGGAPLQPVGSKAESNNRVYTMHANGTSNAFGAPDANNPTRFMSHDSTNGDVTGIVLVPGGSAETLALNFQESSSYDPSTLAFFSDADSFETPVIPFTRLYNASAKGIIGWTRQLGTTPPLRTLNVYRDSGGNDVGYSLSQLISTASGISVTFLA